MEEYETTKDERYAVSITRAVVRKNRKKNITDGFLMTVSPSVEYVKHSKFEPFKNVSYLERDKNFSGIVLYHNMEGNFINGWRYENGVPYSIEIKENDIPALELRSSLCFYSSISYSYNDTECESSDLSISGSISEGGNISEVVVCPKIEVVITYESCIDFGGGDGDIDISDLGDSSSGGDGSDSGSTPLAKSIFRNSNMSPENWKALEKMIEKLLKDCMGNNLYEGLLGYLNGKTLTIEFGASSNSFSYNGETAGITLRDMESNRLFHEMWHAYQAYNESDATYRNSLINQEIEARYAQYLYVSGLPEYQPGSKWWLRYYDNGIGTATRQLKDYINQDGSIIPGQDAELSIHLHNMVGTLWTSSAYRDYQFDYDRSNSQNFKNLNKLTIDC